jgi:hypothetical protein
MYSENNYVIKALLTRHAQAKNYRKKFNVRYNFMKIDEDPDSPITQDIE